MDSEKYFTGAFMTLYYPLAVVSLNLPYNFCFQFICKANKCLFSPKLNPAALQPCLDFLHKGFCPDAANQLSAVN